MRSVIILIWFPMQMPIDHFGNTSGTFKNRYWVNDTYYEAGGPVFRTWMAQRPSASIPTDCLLVFDSGEQNAEPLLPYYLQVSVFHANGMSCIEIEADMYVGVSRTLSDNEVGEAL